MKRLLVVFLAGTLLGCAASRPGLSPPLKAGAAQPDSPPTRPVPDPAAITEPAGPLSLNQALQLALEHNPELAGADFQLQGARTLLRQAKALPRPVIGLELEDIAGSGPLRRLDGSETTVTLSQLVELGGKRALRRQEAELKNRQAELALTARRIELFRQVARGYIELVFYRDKLKLSDELQTNIRATIEALEKRVQAGKDAPLELDRARLTLARGALRHEEIQRIYRLKQHQLTLLWGNPDPRFTQVSGHFDPVELPPDLDQLTRALDQNPQLLREALELCQHRLELETARAEGIPDLTVTGGARYAREPDSHGFLIGLELPLPSPGLTRARVQQAQAAIRQGRARARAVRNALISEIVRLHGELTSAAKRIAILRREALGPAREIYQALQTSYTRGKTDYLNLLDARRTWFACRDEMIDALTRYHLARTELECLLARDLESIFNATGDSDSRPAPMDRQDIPD